MPDHLAVKPSPLAGESLRGYLLRLREANDLPETVDLYKLAFHKPTRNSPRLPGLRKALDGLLSLRGRSQIFPGTTTKTRTIGLGGESVAEVCKRTGKGSPLCPKCLNSSPALRAVWDLAAVTVCPIHGCWLISRCPACYTDVSWRRKRVVRCACGFNFTDTQVTAAPPSLCALTCLIQERFGEELLGQHHGDYSLPLELQDADLNQILSLFSIFRQDRMLSAVVEAPKIEHACARLLAESSIALSVVELLTDWPHGWQAMQEKLSAACFGDQYGPDYLVIKQEAVEALPILRTKARRESEDLPRIVGEHVAAHLAQRRVRIGLMALYSTAPMTSPSDKPGQRTLRYLRSFGGPNLQGAQLSRSAVGSILSASEHQLSLLARAKVIEPPLRAWCPAIDIDSAFERLMTNVASRPYSDRSAHVPLSYFSWDEGEVLLDAIQQIKSGDVACVTRLSAQIPSLSNLYIHECVAREHGWLL